MDKRRSSVLVVAGALSGVVMVVCNAGDGGTLGEAPSLRWSSERTAEGRNFVDVGPEGSEVGVPVICFDSLISSLG